MNEAVVLAGVDADAAAPPKLADELLNGRRFEGLLGALGKETKVDGVPQAVLAA